MKKIGILISVIVLLVLGGYFFLPELLFSSAWGQKIILDMEGDEVATFYFKENQQSRDTIYMRGVIYSNTLEDIKSAFDSNPQLTTLVMEDVPGSIDDEVNLLASREIRKRNINTYIPDSGMVASGGTDMFLAGKRRDIHETALLGVHSWGGGDLEALEYPRDHEEHEKYLDYYVEMDIPTDFYWYTLEAAPADSIHWMTFYEIGKYKVVTESLSLDRMLNIQKLLSLDEFMGRKAGENESSQQVIQGFYESIGLKSFNDDYSHSFPYEEEETKEEKIGKNLIGYIEGSTYKDQYFVIGAHYDHLGVQNGTIYNGADDNASGTAALMILARYFSLHPPKHSIIFAAFDAEEQGLFGSQYFVDNPPVGIDQIKINFNFDMISRNPHDEIYVVGTFPYPQFKSLIESQVPKSFLTVSYGHDDPNDKSKDYWMYSSDNAPFFESGIPNITFSEEDHPGYHQPTDDFEYINQDFYKEVVRFIKNSIEEIDQNFPDPSI